MRVGASRRMSRSIGSSVWYARSNTSVVTPSSNEMDVFTRLLCSSRITPAGACACSLHCPTVPKLSRPMAPSLGGGPIIKARVIATPILR